MKPSSSEAEQLLAFVTEAFVATPQLSSSLRHDAYRTIKALLVTRSETPLSAKEVFDNWSAYLRPVDREDFKAVLVALAQSATAATPASARAVALEEAAKVCDEEGRSLGQGLNPYGSESAYFCATKIRALASLPEARQPACVLRSGCRMQNNQCQEVGHCLNEVAPLPATPAMGDETRSVLTSARVFLDEFSAAGNKYAPPLLKRIDKLLKAPLSSPAPSGTAKVPVPREVYDAAVALVPLLEDGWDGYDDTADQEAGTAACDRLIAAVNEMLRDGNEERDMSKLKGFCTPEQAAELDEIERRMNNDHESSMQRACTCHPDDNPPVPCPQKFALSECRAAAERRKEKPQPSATPRTDAAIGKHADFEDTVSSALARQLERELAAREREACTFEKRTTCSFAASASGDMVPRSELEACNVEWNERYQQMMETEEKLRAEIKGLRGFKASVDEALNMGDGTYKP